MDALREELTCSDLVVGHRHSGFRLGPIDLTLDGGVTVLLGRNGAGKSTLIRALVGLTDPARGSVLLTDDLGEVHRATSPFARRSVGYVPQRFDAHLRARVNDLLAYCAWLKGVPRHEVAERREKALAEVGLSGFERRRVGELSGGERQRLSIGIALLHGPSVLILDEPSAGLDLVQRVQLKRIIEHLGHNHAVLLSTHLTEDIPSSTKRLLVLKSGQVSFDGRLADVGEDLEAGLWHLLDGDAA